MTRPARVSIDPDALRHNLARCRQYAPDSRIMAIVKADAYGHGIARVAGALADADGFGVACVEEARQLREAGASARILLLEGPCCADELTVIRQLRLDAVIHHEDQLDMLDANSAGAPVNVWLKIDSGMHRLGFAPEHFAGLWARLKQHPGVADNIRLISHLACANEPDNAMTREQLEVFLQTTRGYPAENSIANSAAIIGWPQCHLDWVRPGLMLYGASPLDGARAAEFDLRPVMSLQSALIAVKRLRRGDPVGYGASWRCPEDMPVGIVAAGYGDGYPRHAGSGTPVLVNGKTCALIGRPSMDMLTLDLRSCPDARPGNPVLLWGQGLPVEETAAHANAIPHQLLCGVSKRLAYVESNA